MRVVVVGAGYVGVVSSVCLAARGHDIVCVDVNPGVVGQLNAGVPHIHEPGLPELLDEVRRSGRFRATADLPGSLHGADIAIIAVGTPSEDGIIDLRYVGEVARVIGRYLATTDRFLPIVVKSTVIPGTTDTYVRGQIEANSGRVLGAFGLGMNPEFLREGEAMQDFMDPDRIVLGHEDTGTLAALEVLYASWECDKLRVNTRTAELIKYASNALLAVQISAINEIANFAAAIGGIDVMDVVLGIHLDRRWNPIQEGKRVTPGILSYLVPGCGFGGSCFPKDVQALRSQGTGQGLPMSMLNAVLAVNDAQPHQVVNILERDRPVRHPRTCLLLGLAFKPNTDDVRYTASLRIAADLLECGYRVIAHDPVATAAFRQAFGPRAQDITFVEDWQSSVEAADVIIIATRWAEYGALARMDLSGKTLFDARRMLDPAALTTGTYLAIGRQMVR